MTPTKNKLEEMYINFWEPYNLFSLFNSIYASIIMCKKIKKTQILYFYLKEKFIDIF